MILNIIFHALADANLVRINDLHLIIAVFPVRRLKYESWHYNEEENNHFLFYDQLFSVIGDDTGDSFLSENLQYPIKCNRII